MKVNFLDLTPMHQRLKPEIFKKLEELYDRNEFIHAAEAKAFEIEFAEYNQTNYACALDTGTSAVELALKAVGVGHGSEVISVANTFIATVAGIHFCGAKPVFVEPNINTFNIDYSKVEEKITPKTKAILAVNLYGRPVNVIELRKIADKHNLPLILDSAQSIGSKIKIDNEWVSPSKIADLATFSFYPGKNLGACGEGGAVVCNNEKYADYIKMFRDHGMKEKYIHEIVGKNHRMDGFQAGVLRIKLKHIDSWNEKRRKIAEMYYNQLKDIEQLKLPVIDDNLLPVWHLFVVLVENRDDFTKFLAENDIYCGYHYKIPVHLQKAFAHLGLKKGDLPITESIVEQNVSLPMYPDLTESEVNYVCSKIKEYFKK